jgi:hypothetical protein
MRVTPFGLLLSALVSVGCGVGTQKNLFETALADDAERAVAFEATLRVLDAHPAWVDQLFIQALAHPKALEAFINASVRRLDDEALSKLMAKHLVLYPPSLYQVMIRTLDAVQTRPDGRASLDRAIHDRAAVVADVLSDDGPAVRAVMVQSVEHIAKKGEARAALLEAMQATSPTLAAMIVNNPKTMRRLMEEVVKIGARESRELLLDLFKLGGDKGEEKDEKKEPKK